MLSAQCWPRWKNWDMYGVSAISMRHVLYPITIALPITAWRSGFASCMPIAADWRQGYQGSLGASRCPSPGRLYGQGLRAHLLRGIRAPSSALGLAGRQRVGALGGTRP